MPLQCRIIDDYQNVALSFADWSALAPQVECRALTRRIDDEDQLAAELAEADIIVIMRERTPFTAALFARLPRLKLLVTSGMRNAAVDLAAAKAHGVTVCGTDSGSAAPVELAWALILGLARHLISENLALRRNGPWQSTVGIGLSGKRLGLLGLGKTGRRMARIALAFGMEVSAWSRNLTAEDAASVGVTLAASKEALLSDSDIVSIHLVLSERTRGLLGAAELARMKPSALLINTSRAAIVDQSALLHALRAGNIAGAGLDVFDSEPLPADHPLRTLPNVLATPHLGYVADDNYRIYFTQAVEDIQAFLAGTPLRVLGA
ncbi:MULTISPECIES: D-2-hydroxyacid dehydrogenase family protein [unclassified Brenneria]|uniref:D-2-hydroxyacid dehydrogenase family protein n=1 Tax=unclassified Brenneria TaxID=2634434 RepID=UPI0029C32C77|nr:MULTISPECIES: D-2-hydroxyacid dehydrogenase family protein [unclassified Brenneria]MDX5629132.1 D-2-hydroxyacid dehydrogenase family protein [Brenneria sp. L3-3Z]MDX5696271.1 D-2-hydroxyacid dehydrogenase family protein [Brenneria sp. L4-2C]